MEDQKLQQILGIQVKEQFGREQEETCKVHHFFTLMFLQTLLSFFLGTHTHIFVVPRFTTHKHTQRCFYGALLWNFLWSFFYVFICFYFFPHNCIYNFLFFGRKFEHAHFSAFLQSCFIYNPRQKRPQTKLLYSANTMHKLVLVKSYHIPSDLHAHTPQGCSAASHVSQNDKLLLFWSGTTCLLFFAGLKLLS